MSDERDQRPIKDREGNLAGWLPEETEEEKAERFGQAMNATDFEIVSIYSRAEAIEDGILVDVSQVARQMGFKIPVAVTRGVWTECVEVPPMAVGQDKAGRLWDVLWMLRVAIRPGAGDVVKFAVRVGKRRVQLWSRCGPGDTAEPVITVMLEGED